MPATFGIDGDAGRGKRFDVAQDGARGDLELFGQGIRGQLAALTQQKNQRHQAVSSHDGNATQYLTQGVVIECQGGKASPDCGDARTGKLPMESDWS